MISTQSRNINLFKLLTLLIIMVLVGSCALFKKKCPLPTCEIRKSHRHLLIFTKEPKAKKKNKKNNLTDSTAFASDSLSMDSTSHEGHDHEGHNHEGHDHDEEDEHRATYVEVDGEVLDEEGNAYVDPKEKKRLEKQKKKDDKRAAKAEKKAAKAEKKAEKKKAKLAKQGKEVDEEDDEGDFYLEDSDVEDEGDDEVGDYDGMTEEEYKERRIKEHAGDTVTVRGFTDKELAKQLKADDKAAKKASKKAEKEAKKGSKGESDYTKLYRSRVTKWWRRDQNPKTGKHFKVKKNKSTRVY